MNATHLIESHDGVNYESASNIRLVVFTHDGGKKISEKIESWNNHSFVISWYQSCQQYM